MRSVTGHRESKSKLRHNISTHLLEQLKLKAAQRQGLVRSQSKMLTHCRWDSKKAQKSETYVHHPASHTLPNVDQR